MPLKKIKDLGRVPERADAIRELSPNAAFGIANNDYNKLDWQSPDIAKPSEEEVEAKLTELTATWAAVEYQKERFKEYPKIEDQLALLWDDMNSGVIPGKETSTWFASIQEVKNNIPKP